MRVASNDDIEHDLLEDFFYDFTEQYQHCEDILIQLERTPNDTERTRDLFRSVHTIKGNLIYIGLKDLSPLLQSVEDLLEGVRSGTIAYDDSLSDVVLLAMDKTKLLIDENIHHQASDISQQDFDNICASIRDIASAKPQTRPEAIIYALAQLDPQTTLPPPVHIPQKTPNDEFLLEMTSMGISICEDLRFINGLIIPLEERSQYWQGNTYRIAQLAIRMNQQANQLVTPNQLLMAALIHDIAMPFLPIELLHKKASFGDDERDHMRAHVGHSVHLLKSMGGWDEAAEIVQQHHERCDGSGYPSGLTRTQIGAGAKILAIADTFNACRYARAYRTEQKRPLIRAILEINRQSGSLFDDSWVQVFNQVAKQTMTLH
ncbi:MAG: HD domain-containing phosphohydrolase [Cellvibrionaceae bacterium]